MDEGTDDDSEVHAECVEVNAERKQKKTLVCYVPTEDVSFL